MLKRQIQLKLCRTMLLLGIGPAEVKGLKGEHFDLKRRQITCFRLKTRKHYTPAIYPHAQKFVDHLNEQGRLKQGQAVFTWRTPEKAFKTACRALGHAEYELRALRRCLIVHLLEQGTDPRLVAEWQGHADTRLIFSTYGKYIGKDYKRCPVKEAPSVINSVAIAGIAE